MKFMTRLNFLAGLIAAFVLIAIAVLPGLAQDTVVQTDENLTIVTGAIHFTPEGDIMVAGIVIAPAGAFNPSGLAEGDIVIITGVMLNETTLQATALEFFDDENTPEATPEPEATMEATAEATMEATEEATPEATPEATETPAPVADCGTPNHPVATHIAETFGVDYNEVMLLHCEGNGFGNIIRAYALAEAADDASTARDFIDRHHGGEGWGQIMRDSDVHPSDLAPGKVLKNHGNTEDDGTTTDGSTTNGSNGNGHGNGGNGNGNNGNGGGNGNGNGNGGNGNGNNGNGGGNGHGNGNGKNH
ncbi:MAG: hypothetical protein R3E39_32300 [Anaerolineae bacterium]